MNTICIRPVEPADNPFLAAIIRETLLEFGVARPGTAYYDKSLDNMYANFQVAGSRYYVGQLAGGIAGDKGMADGGCIAGGGGIYPSDGLPTGVCELVKMYLAPDARGHGVGRILLETCLEFARETGYRQVYIETMPELEKAISLYRRFGFHHLDSAMGNTGHYGCLVWMLKDL